MLDEMALSRPRHQQLRRLRRALARGVQATAVIALMLTFADLGALVPAVAAGIAGVGLLLDGVHGLRLSARSSIGAASEAQVRRALKPLRAEGWRVEHGVLWPGGGDIDHVARSPAGVWFAIETKTRRYSCRQLERTAATARWLARRGRGGGGAVAVLCVTRGRRRPVIEHGVLVVSLAELPVVLRELAASRASRRAGSRLTPRAFGGRAAVRW